MHVCSDWWTVGGVVDEWVVWCNDGLVGDDLMDGWMSLDEDRTLILTNASG